MSSYKQSSHHSNYDSAKCLQISTKPSHKTHQKKGSTHDLRDVSEFDMPMLNDEYVMKNQQFFNKNPSYKSFKGYSALLSPRGELKFKPSDVPIAEIKKQHSAKLPKHKRYFSAGEDVLVKFQQELEMEKKRNEKENRILFNYLHAIGKGGFGKVWKVQCKKNGKIYALKEMSKALILAKKSIPSVMGERKLLSALRSNFLVNMIESFQDRENLYLVMDYLPGGDLRSHLSIKKSFSESQAKFIIVCILLGLEALHQKNIIHRDIKPENIVFDTHGYARITDLGVAKVYRENNAEDTSGTPGYMAPQVLCGQNHSFSVDHFALGVIAFELMFKHRPLFGRNRKQIRDEIFSRNVQIKKNEIPQDWSLQSADFINRLIQRKANNRLGYSGGAQIRNHPWLRQYPFEQVQNHKFVAPYQPKYQTMEDLSGEIHENRELMLQHAMLLREPEIQKLFLGYDKN